MKLLSGHEVSEVTGKEKENQKDFKAYGDVGLITLNPGNWFFLDDFLKYADKLYQFPFKSEDTLIMTYPKCGTTWTQEIVWTMVNNPDLDNPEAKKSLNIRAPFLDSDFLFSLPYLHQFMDLKKENPFTTAFMKLCPEKNPADGIIVQMAEAMKGRRTLKTHLPFSFFDPKLIDTCKVVYVARNPKDVCINYLHHSRLIRAHDFKGSLESFTDLFLSDRLLWSPYWTHMKEAWNQRSHPNLHFIFYEDLKTNPSEQINLLAKFLGKSLSHKQLQNIVDYTSFSSMKSRSDDLDLLPDGLTNFDIFKVDGGFLRKGESGDGKKKLTPELESKFDAWIEANTRDMEDLFKYKPKAQTV